MSATKILVADDEAHVTNVVALKLRKAGFDVVTAGNGAEALEQAKAQRFGLVITDCQMPEMDGLALCQRLRDDPDTCEIPAIMLTGRGFEISEADTQATNIRRILPKPFSPREVLATVQELLAAEPAASQA